MHPLHVIAGQVGIDLGGGDIHVPQHPLHGPQAELNSILKKLQKLEESLTGTDDRIYLVNSDLVDRPSPRLVKGLEKLARLIHPELFEADSENN